MILDYLSPIRIYRRLTIHIKELTHYRTFKKIIFDLNASGKLDEIGIKADPNLNMYIGINLNPELLLYSDASQESVELNILSIEVINSTLEIIMEKYKTLKSNQTLDKMKKNIVLN